MSRCFPLPLTGYTSTRSVDSHHKVHKGEEEKALRDEKKEKRRLKKQLKREAKEKEKSLKSATVESSERGHKKRRRDEGEELKKAEAPKEKVNETLPYEKSNLTEEHEWPLACATDKSAGIVMGSNKKQTTSLLPDCVHNSGGTFRIRLPLQRHEGDIPISASSTPQLRLRTDDLFPAKLREEKLPMVQPSVNAQIQTEQPCLPPCSTVDINHQTKPHFSSTLRGRHVPSSVKKYQKLFDNWAPPRLQTELVELNDLDWLLHKSSDRTCRASGRRCLAPPTLLSYSTSSPAVHACYLPDADVYALPYTVPF